MEILFEKFFRKIDSTDCSFIRSKMVDIRWDARLIGIKGARGVGKTTLMLQYIKENLQQNGSALYVSLDNIWFAENKLSTMADEFVKKGGRHLFLDEVHKYPNWSQEIKNIYDDYSELQIVFTGSSLLEILNARADLSRRAIVYEMQGLSFREFLNMKLGLNLEQFTLEELLAQHTQLARKIIAEVKPLQHFDEYLKSGYFPFFREIPELYHQRLEEVVNMALEIELPLLRKVDIAYIPKLKQLLQIISESVPFIPNVSKLSQRIGINRNTFVSYLFFLQEAHIIRNLYKDVRGITQLQKPDKIYLENTNFQFAFAAANADQGNLRETFFLNQLNHSHKVEYIDRGDFRVDRKYVFEIGGKSKSQGQIREASSGFIAADGLEYGMGNKIPLWMFGFLY